MHNPRPSRFLKENAMRVVLEIRAGEGGSDAKLLVGEQAKAYVRQMERRQL
jgi:protein subunit release factor A